MVVCFKGCHNMESHYDINNVVSKSQREDFIYFFLCVKYWRTLFLVKKAWSHLVQYIHRIIFGRTNNKLL